MSAGSSAPPSPEKLNRLRAIARTVKESEELAQRQRALLHLEVQRQEAEEELESINQQLDENVNGLSLQFSQVSLGLAHMREQLAPPRTPTHHAAPAHIHKDAMVQPSPSRPLPGSTLDDSDDGGNSGLSAGDPVYPGSNYPAYVVYAGRDHQHGVFYAWKTYGNIQGAQDICNVRDHNHVVKTFSSRDLAQQFYQEFADAGIPDLLAAQEPADNERFVVIEGVKPMACRDRKSLIMTALQFRGGVVYRYRGDMAGAWAKFRQFQDRGEVKSTHKPRTTF
ncbi:hypothetical protein EV361DRAFT_955055 [Lentinula raphanica]|nr:hypothetical protein EV361DRAFT_955055 [Lentinula raphanica]